MRERDSVSTNEPPTTTSANVRKRGRPRKFDDATAMSKLIEAGAHRLRDTGYSPGLSAVSLERAIRDAEVPRGAAYRLWNEDENAPQELFRNAVLLRMFDLEITESLFVTLDGAIAGSLARHQADIESDDKPRRRFAGRSLIREISDALDEAIMSSDAFRMSRSLANASPATINIAPEVRDAMERSDQALKAKYADMLRQLFALFGSRPRAPFTFEHLVELGSALNDGLHNQISEADPETLVMRPTGRHGELETWSLFAIGFESFLSFFSEDDVLRSAIDEEVDFGPDTLAGHECPAETGQGRHRVARCSDRSIPDGPCDRGRRPLGGGASARGHRWSFPAAERARDGRSFPGICRGHRIRDAC